MLRPPVRTFKLGLMLRRKSRVLLHITQTRCPIALLRHSVPTRLSIRVSVTQMKITAFTHILKAPASTSQRCIRRSRTLSPSIPPKQSKPHRPQAKPSWGNNGAPLGLGAASNCGLSGCLEWNPPPCIVQQGRLRLQLPLGLPNVAYAKGVVHMAPGGEGCCPHSQREGSTSGNSQATGRASHG